MLELPPNISISDHSSLSLTTDEDVAVDIRILAILLPLHLPPN